jgi:hypothetical protein
MPCSRASENNHLNPLPYITSTPSKFLEIGSNKLILNTSLVNFYDNKRKLLFWSFQNAVTSIFHLILIRTQGNNYYLSK